MERTRKIAGVLAVTVGVCLAATALAQEKGQKAIDDKGFIRKVSECNYAEIHCSKLAVKQAASEDVRQFAQKMVDGHTKLAKELEPLASSTKAQLATGLEKDQQVNADKLAKLRGAEFDRAYMAEQVKGHQEAVDMFEEKAKTGQGEVKAFAAKTLPALKEHLKHAKEIQSKLEKGDK